MDRANARRSKLGVRLALAVNYSPQWRRRARVHRSSSRRSDPRDARRRDPAPGGSVGRSAAPWGRRGRCDPGLSGQSVHGLFDHLPMAAEDWALVGWRVNRLRTGAWSRPWIVLCEYAGVGPDHVRRHARAPGASVSDMVSRGRSGDGTTGTRPWRIGSLPFRECCHILSAAAVRENVGASWASL